MAKKAPPGWYEIEDGGTAEWNGREWTGEYRPPVPTDKTPGWRPESEGISRWWSGSAWSDARIAADGHIDVARSVGQKVMTATYLGGGDDQVIATFMQELESLPPCRIETLQTSHTAFVAGTNLVAVVSWVGPR